MGKRDLHGQREKRVPLVGKASAGPGRRPFPEPLCVRASLCEETPDPFPDVDRASRSSSHAQA